MSSCLCTCSERNHQHIKFTALCYSFILYTICEICYTTWILYVILVTITTSTKWFCFFELKIMSHPTVRLVSRVSYRSSKKNGKKRCRLVTDGDSFRFCYSHFATLSTEHCYMAQSSIRRVELKTNILLAKKCLSFQLSFVKSFRFVF